MNWNEEGKPGRAVGSENIQDQAQGITRVVPNHLVHDIECPEVRFVVCGAAFRLAQHDPGADQFSVRESIGGIADVEALDSLIFEPFHSHAMISWRDRDTDKAELPLHASRITSHEFS